MTRSSSVPPVPVEARSLDMTPPKRTFSNWLAGRLRTATPILYRLRPLVRDDLQTAQNRQPKPGAGPCGESRIALRSRGLGGFRRRGENAALLPEAFRRPPLYTFRPVPDPTNVYGNPAVRQVVAK